MNPNRCVFPFFHGFSFLSLSCLCSLKWEVKPVDFPAFCFYKIPVLYLRKGWCRNQNPFPSAWESFPVYPGPEPKDSRFRRLISSVPQSCVSPFPLTEKVSFCVWQGFSCKLQMVRQIQPWEILRQMSGQSQTADYGRDKKADKTPVSDKCPETKRLHRQQGSDIKLPDTGRGKER